MTGPIQPRDHTISLADAAVLTARHRDQVTAQGARAAGVGELGGAFTKDGVIELLNQPYAAYLRYYHARDANGEPHLILVASDASGDDIVTGGAKVLDNHWPCPFFCPVTASVLRG